MVDILHRVGVAATPERVYAALTTVDGVAGWWSGETSSTGGLLQVCFGDADGFDLETAACVPNQRLEWAVVAGPAEWVGTTITFELAADGDWTIVLFKHAGWREPVEYMYDCSTQWAMFLMSLKSLCETGAGRPYPDHVPIHNLR
jgi:uncharacterized protein YndB with AHSA1/START domain